MKLLEYDFEQSVAYWVVMTAQAFERALNEQLSSHGITYRQWQVLGWLAHEGELSQVELAERMRIEPPTLVGILDRMERAGWVVRRDCPDDRRKKLICPSPQVRPVWSQITECAKSVRGQAIAGLTDSELSELERILAIVQGNLKRVESVSTSNGNGHA